MPSVLLHLWKVILNKMPEFANEVIISAEEVARHTCPLPVTANGTPDFVPSYLLNVITFLTPSVI
jgi:hypothetical protein